MSKKDTDVLIVRDATGRRTFLRQGATFILGSAALSTSVDVLADDCDRGVTDSKQKQAMAGSDSDAGDSADPAGCGRRKDEVPARFRESRDDDLDIPDVVKVDEPGR